MKNFDISFLSEQVKLIAGIDEAGRGPLAGPVVAAAVIFDNETVIEYVNDSKQVKEKKREELYDEIISKALCFGIGIVDHIEIDKINILQASLKAMKIAASQLNPLPDLMLIDGNKTFYSEIETKAIVKGDSKSFAIAAASILAKVTRDRIMIKAAEEYPHYHWDKNKGYPTKEHISCIHQHGITPLHRLTFLKKILPEKQDVML